MANQKPQSRLQEHFSHLRPQEQASGWEAMWKEQTTPWDRKAPSPALIDALHDHSELFGPPLKNRQQHHGHEQPARKKALVPGCGRGYDVLLLASQGYDAYGLDVSPSAIHAANDVRDESDMEQQYPVRSASYGRGEMRFLVADFFQDDFLAEIGSATFDVIYDYTFLCALAPIWRPRWAKRMSQLLSPTGHLTCLEFPLSKSPKDPGPPYGLSAELYEQLLNRPGHDVPYAEDGHVRLGPVGDKADNALTRVDRWKPRRTHKAGESSDHVSIWRHAR